MIPKLPSTDQLGSLGRPLKDPCFDALAKAHKPTSQRVTAMTLGYSHN